MKKIVFIIIFLLVLLNNITVQAVEDNSSSYKDTAEVQELYDYMTKTKSKYEILKDVDIKTYVQEYIKNGSGKFSISEIVKAIASYLFSEVIGCIRLMSALIIISVICALISNLQKAFSNENLSGVAYFACYSLIIIIIAKSFYIGVNEVKSAVKEMTDFMTALMPVLLMLLASGGRIVQSAVMDPIIIFAINFSAAIYANVIIPLILMAFVLQFVNNISEDYKIDKLTKLLNQSVLWIQGILMTVFIGIVTIRGVSSKAMDEVTAKTAKFAVDNFVPIVGKCLSDAISTVIGYSVLLKGAISSIGLIFLVIMVAFPIIKIMIMAFINKLTAALVQPISDKRIVNCINSAGDTLILLGSCLIAMSVMFFIMISIIASIGSVS